MEDNADSTCLEDRTGDTWETPVAGSTATGAQAEFTNFVSFT